MDEATLNACGCCEGSLAEGAAPSNAPGLSALAWRVGTHGTFVEALRARISTEPALRALATREPSDPSVALLDAWAVVLDVLTFYQERLANEGFLRTATERRSVLELARAIGYELRPGVAASTCLAFTLDAVKGSPAKVRLDVGTRAQSVPEQDEVAQTYETIEEIEARPEWNAMQPQLTLPSLPLKLGSKKVYLNGTATGLQPGDALLFIGDERVASPTNDNWDFRRVASLEIQARPPTEGPSAGTTVVTLDRGLGSFQPPVTPSQKNAKVYALRQRAAVFGYNAMEWKALPDVTKAAYFNATPAKDPATLTAAEKAEWPGFHPFLDNHADGTHSFDLDAVYPKIVAGGGWLVFSVPEYQEVFRIKSAVESARAAFGLSGKTTLVTLKEGENADKFANRRREVVVYAQSEELAFAERPITDPVSGSEIVIAPAVDGLEPGRLLAVSGTHATTGEAVAEVSEIHSVQPVGTTTRVVLTEPLAHAYLRERDKVAINANVARATHGATTVDEVLGSGDGSIAFQRFELKGKPLTHVSAPVPGGGASTLELRVKKVLWKETPSFYETGAGDRVFVARRSDDGQVTVQFGDGVHGARLPTGSNNVAATYRVGVGLAGNVQAGAITTLLSRPLGLKAVTNPIAATGADDPESPTDARANAPLTVLTLDRIVSVRDFEDFARAFSGVGKARAELLWNGERQLVHLTVAGTGEAPVDPASQTFTNLLAAIDAARHADQPVRVSPHVPLTFAIAARVATDPDRVRDDVLAAVHEALRQAFSFEARSFGQGVTSSEVLAVMQRVEGVVAVDLDALDDLDPIAHPNLPARLARWEAGAILGAELLVVDSAGITLTDLTT